MDARSRPTPDSEIAAERRRRLTSIALMCAGVACLTCVDTVAKALVGYMPTLEVVWARNVAGVLFAAVFLNPFTRPALLLTTRPLLQLTRSTLAIVCSMTYFAAFKYLQLDQTTAILFSVPLLIALISGPVLKERISPQRWAAILVGFLGVLVITRPSLGGLHPAMLLCLGGAVSYAVFNIITRVLSRTDANETTLFYTNVVGAIALTPAMPFVWVMPADLVTVGLMLMLGLLGAIGHFLTIAAHRLAPASVLAPYIYTQIATAVTLGYLVFGDVPSRWTLLGAAIVIGSGLYLLANERAQRGGP